jgi:hypothetical protein
MTERRVLDPSFHTAAQYPPRGDMSRRLRRSRSSP